MVETYGTQNLLNTKTYHTKHLTLGDGLGPPCSACLVGYSHSKHILLFEFAMTYVWNFLYYA